MRGCMYGLTRPVFRGRVADFLGIVREFSDVADFFAQPYEAGVLRWEK